MVPVMAVGGIQDQLGHQFAPIVQDVGKQFTPLAELLFALCLKHALSSFSGMSFVMFYMSSNAVKVGKSLNPSVVM